MMSPARFVVTMTSNCAGSLTIWWATLSMMRCWWVISGYSVAISSPIRLNIPSVSLRMFALVATVTFVRPSRRASSNAYRMIFSEPLRLMILRATATSRVSRYSTPAYRSSMFSRTTMKSMPSPAYRVGTPGIWRAGRMLAYVSNSLRSVTLALFSPKPTGVSSGPLSATRVRAMESAVSRGTPVVSPRRKTSAPASASSQVIATPTASMMRRVAAVISGPTPSPGMSVTRWDMGRPASRIVGSSRRQG